MVGSEPKRGLYFKNHQKASKLRQIIINIIYYILSCLSTCQNLKSHKILRVNTTNISYLNMFYPYSHASY